MAPSYSEYQTTMRAFIAAILQCSRKIMNDNGDIVWCSGGLVLTTLTAKKMADAGDYDEIDGFRIYDAAIVEHEDWFKHQTAAEQRADKADYDLDNARNR